MKASCSWRVRLPTSSPMSMSDASSSASASAYKPLRTERYVNRIGFSQRLELRQSQTLVMTPQLQQAIRMLQLSNLELSDFVDSEIQQNPLLERREHEITGRALDRHDNGAEPSGSAPLEDFAPEFGEIWRAASGAEGD